MAFGIGALYIGGNETTAAVEMQGMRQQHEGEIGAFRSDLAAVQAAKCVVEDAKSMAERTAAAEMEGMRQQHEGEIRAFRSDLAAGVLEG